MNADESLILPPMLDGPIQGTLDVILMQPSMTMKVPPEYDLSVSVHWWGSKVSNIMRINSSDEMVRATYKVCCDWKNFRRYIYDTKQLKCIINYEGSPANDAASKTLLTKLKAGEPIGKFCLRDINLNSNNTFIQDCTILNPNNELCGSITALLFYKGISKESHPRNTFISKFLSPTPAPKADRKYSQKGSPNINSKISKTPPLRKAIAGQRETMEILPNRRNNAEPSHSVVQRNVMPELLSLVESGAVKASDFPLLVQIMEGRTPSLDSNAIRSKLPLKTRTQSPDQAEYLERSEKSTPETPKEHENFPKASVPPEEMSSTLPHPKDCDHDMSCEPSEEAFEGETPMLYLRIDSLTLNVTDEDIDHFGHQDSPISDKRFFVKQRSKVGYLIEVSLVNEYINFKLPATFISRQISLGVVTFNCQKLIRLPDIRGMNSANSLQFSVRSRKMGERQGMDLGTCEFPLSSGMRHNICRCAIWPPSAESSIRPKGFITMAMNMVLSANCPSQQIPVEESANEPALSIELKPLTPTDKLASFCKSKSPDKAKCVLNQKFQSPFKSSDCQSHAAATVEAPSEEQTQGIPANKRASQIEDLNVNIELIKGSSLPIRRVGTSGNFYYPNTYVLLNTWKTVRTPIYQGSSHPKWNFVLRCCIDHRYLIQTDNHIVLKVYHSQNGRSCSSTDPLLGFVSISLSQVKQRPIQGWFPVLNLEGNIYGKIKVLITLDEGNVQPSQQKENNDPNMAYINSQKNCEHYSQKVSDVILKATNTNSKPQQPPFVVTSAAVMPEQPTVVTSSAAKPLQPDNVTLSAAKPEQPTVVTSSAAKPLQPADVTSSAAKPEQPPIVTPSAQNPLQPADVTSSTAKPEQPTIVTLSTAKPEHPTVVTSPAIKPSTASLERFMWTNQLNNLESPAASYVDLSQPRKTKKVRMKAGLNFY